MNHQMNHTRLKFSLQIMFDEYYDEYVPEKAKGRKDGAGTSGKRYKHLCYLLV